MESDYIINFVEEVRKIVGDELGPKCDEAVIIQSRSAVLLFIGVTQLSPGEKRDLEERVYLKFLSRNKETSLVEDVEWRGGIQFRMVMSPPVVSQV